MNSEILQHLIESGVTNDKSTLLLFLQKQDSEIPEFLFPAHCWQWLYELVETKQVSMSYRCNTVFYRAKDSA